MAKLTRVRVIGRRPGPVLVDSLHLSCVPEMGFSGLQSDWLLYQITGHMCLVILGSQTWFRCSKHQKQGGLRFCVAMGKVGRPGAQGSCSSVESTRDSATASRGLRVPALLSWTPPAGTGERPQLW